MNDHDNANSIAVHRNALHWSQHTLDVKSGVHETYIGRIELGRVDPRISRVRKISRALGVPLCQLYADVSCATHANPSPRP